MKIHKIDYFSEERKIEKITLPLIFHYEDV